MFIHLQSAMLAELPFDVSNIWDWVIGCVVLATVWRYFRPVQLGHLEAVNLKPADVPPDVSAFFQKQDEVLRPLRFSAAGDYQTVHGKKPNYARFYAYPQGDVFIEADVYRKVMPSLFGARDLLGITCVTVFADGTSMHTGDFPIPDGGAHAPPQLIYRGRPNMTAEALIAAHRQDAAQYAAQHQTTVLQYPPDQLAAVSVYYTQYQREYFVNQGVIPAPDGFARTKAAVAAETEAQEPAMNA